MPKVKKEYFAEKKNMIVEAAIRVCKSKPAYSVTMRDVMRESGISIGGIYFYFSDIDEIFAEIINHLTEEINLGDEIINKVFESGKHPAEILIDAFALLGSMTDNNVRLSGTLAYELNAIYLNEPERGKKVMAKIRTESDANIMLKKINGFITSQTAAGNFNPKIPVNHILLSIGVAFQGVIRTITFRQNSEILQKEYDLPEEDTTAEGMMGIFARIILELL